MSGRLSRPLPALRTVPLASRSAAVRRWEDFPHPWEAVGLLFGGLAITVLGVMLAGRAISALYLLPLATLVPLLFVACYRARHAGRWNWGEWIPARRLPSPFWLALLVLCTGTYLTTNELGNALLHVLPMPNDAFQILFEFDRPGWLQFVLVAVVPGVLEEVLFRGFFLRAFLNRYSQRRALFYSALLFSVAHMNPWQGLLSFVVGLLYGWLVLRTGSLLPAIFLHVVNNGASIYLARLSPDVLPGLTGSESTPAWQGPYLDALGVALLAAGLYACARLTRAPSDDDR